MATALEAKQIRADLKKQQRKWAEKWRQDNDAILKDYDNAIASGKMEEEFLPELLQKHGCGERRIRNVLARRSGSANVKTEALNNAMLIRNFQQLTADLDTAKQEYMEQLEIVEAAEENGEDWISIEKIEGRGGKFGDTDQEKRIHVWEYKARLLERINDLHDRYWNTVSKILPKRLEIVTRTAADYSDEELIAMDEQIGGKQKELSGNSPNP